MSTAATAKIRAVLDGKGHGRRPSDLAGAPPRYVLECYHQGMRTSVIFDDELAAEARELGINVSEAAREGLRQAIRRRRAERDRAAYLALPERDDADWDDAEAWGPP
jgi:hypothetical protein